MDDIDRSVPSQDPRWPEFLRWAKENVPGQFMLTLYWDCWKAASRKVSRNVPRRVGEKRFTEDLLKDVLRAVDHVVIRAKGLEGPGGLYHKANLLLRNGRGGWVRLGPAYPQPDGTLWQMFIRWDPDLLDRRKDQEARADNYKHQGGPHQGGA